MPPIWLNFPATNRWLPTTSRSRTLPLTFGATKVVSIAPVVTFTLNTWPGTDFPPAEVNSPPTYTDLPSVAGSTFQTFPTGLGANDVSSLPVVASNARRFFRVTTVEVPWFSAWVNWPPTTIVLPTWAIEQTVPSRMSGVLLPGSSLTIRP